MKPESLVCSDTDLLRYIPKQNDCACGRTFSVHQVREHRVSCNDWDRWARLKAGLPLKERGQ